METDLLTQLNEQKRKVDFDTFDITVKELVSMVVDGVVDIAPVYQREFRWDDQRQSTLIESVFLGIPIPSLFMAANSDATWELIDGVQRLSTLIRFVGEPGKLEIINVEKPLRLIGLQKLSTFNGSTFEKLPQAIRLQFQLKPLKVTTISDKSDPTVRFDLFERLNTGGVILTDQEIRSCVFRGPFNEFLRDLAEQDIFLAVLKQPKERHRDGTLEEFVLRFFAYFYWYRKFDHSVKDFLNDYMREASERFDYAQNRKLFEDVFGALAHALPDGITRGTRSYTPANLYEAVTVGAAMALQERDTLVVTGIREWLYSDELLKLTTGATNARPKVIGRIEFCRDRFLGRVDAK